MINKKDFLGKFDKYFYDVFIVLVCIVFMVYRKRNQAPYFKQPHKSIISYSGDVISGRPVISCVYFEASLE